METSLLVRINSSKTVATVIYAKGRTTKFVDVAVTGLEEACLAMHAKRDLLVIVAREMFSCFGVATIAR
jgi:hypothetical protein